MKSNIGYDEFWDSIHTNCAFEPTLNPFENGLVINHKKVGTRYFDSLLSLPDDSVNNKIQMDLYITKNPFSFDGKIIDEEKYVLNYKFDTRYCYTEFERNNDTLKSIVRKYFNNTDDFINYCGAGNINELLFNNKKDIIFIVRNPFHRFISGTIQILFSILNEIFNNENLRKEINFFTNLTDSDLKKIVKYAGDVNVNEKSLSNLQNNELERIILYIIENKWNLLFQDIHTQNYLHNYLEWIYNIEDKSKIKIINLKDCRSIKALNFFTELIGSDILKQRNIQSFHYKSNWEVLGSQTGTNKFFYDFIIKKLYTSNINFFNNSALSYYLRDEYQIYKNLIESKYFINLQD